MLGTIQKTLLGVEALEGGGHTDFAIFQRGPPNFTNIVVGRGGTQIFPNINYQ